MAGSGSLTTHLTGRITAYQPLTSSHYARRPMYTLTTLHHLRARLNLGATDTADDARLLNALEAASTSIPPPASNAPPGGASARTGSPACTTSPILPIRLNCCWRMTCSTCKASPMAMAPRLTWGMSSACRIAPRTACCASLAPAPSFICAPRWRPSP